MSHELSIVEAAHYVLGHGGHEGQFRRPGSFYAALTDACFKADNDNLDRLGLSFPMVALAVYLYKNEEGGADMLARLIEEEGAT